MKYKNTVIGTFIDRPNRFIAHVSVNGNTETVHVKNTGRCAELLLPGVKVVLQDFGTETKRKTRYDLICVCKENLGWVNIDSQAPNKVVNEWLQDKDYDYIKPEYTYGASRIDFYLEKNAERILMEVKGCTQEFDGIGYFPDAPTERGVKHLRELTSAIDSGYKCIIAFVIQMEGIDEVRPNIDIHPEFGVALKEATDKGVEVLLLKCRVTENELVIIN